MKYLSNKQVITKLRAVEQIRFDDENQESHLPKNLDVCQYANKCNRSAYKRIRAISKCAKPSTKKIMHRVIMDEVRAWETKSDESALDFYSNVDYSAFGMSHTLDALIDNIKSADERRLKAFARLGA